MSNFNDLRAAWVAYRDAVVGLRKDRDEKRNALGMYAGSKGGDEQLKAVDDAFNSNLASLRDKFSADADAVIKRMKDQAEAARYGKVEAPTQEQLNVLEAVRLMSEVTRADIDQMAQLVSDNEIANKAFYQLCRERLPEAQRDALKPPETLGSRALGQLKLVTRSCRDLRSWDGTSRSEAVRGFAEAASFGVPMGSRQSLEPAAASEVPTDNLEEFKRGLTGIVHDEAACSVLD